MAAALTSWQLLLCSRMADLLPARKTETAAKEVGRREKIQELKSGRN